MRAYTDAAVGAAADNRLDLEKEEAEMLWFVTHGLTWFVGTLVFFVVLAVAGWVFVDFGVAVIVMVAAGIFVALALPLLLMYYDESNPSGHRYPDALR